MARDLKQLNRALEDLSTNLDNSNNYIDYFESLRLFCDNLRYGKLAEAYYGANAVCRILDESHREEQYFMRELEYTMLEVLLAKVESTYGYEARVRTKETITGNW